MSIDWVTLKLPALAKLSPAPLIAPRLLTWLAPLTLMPPVADMFNVSAVITPPVWLIGPWASEIDTVCPAALILPVRLVPNAL